MIIISTSSLCIVWHLAGPCSLLCSAPLWTIPLLLYFVSTGWSYCRPTDFLSDRSCCQENREHEILREVCYDDDDISINNTGDWNSFVILLACSLLLLLLFTISEVAYIHYPSPTVLHMKFEKLMTACFEKMNVRHMYTKEVKKEGTWKF